MPTAPVFPPEPLWTTADVGARVRRAPATVRTWRRLGTGPAFLNLGGRVLYRPADVERWLSTHTVEQRASQ